MEGLEWIGMADAPTMAFYCKVFTMLVNFAWRNRRHIIKGSEDEWWMVGMSL